VCVCACVRARAVCVRFVFVCACVRVCKLIIISRVFSRNADLCYSSS